MAAIHVVALCCRKDHWQFQSGAFSVQANDIWMTDVCQQHSRYPITQHCVSRCGVKGKSTPIKSALKCHVAIPFQSYCWCWNFLVRHTIALSLAILTATGNRRVPRILSIKYVVSVDRITWRLPPPPPPHSFCDDRVKSLCDAAYYESLLFLVIHGPQSRCWHQSRQKQMRGWSEGDISVSIVRWLTDGWLD